MSFSKLFLQEVEKLIAQINIDEIERVASLLEKLKNGGGRLFIVGSGGGAGHASHCVCDFRKLCNIEAYAPYDNVSELTARVNDEGWDTTLINWLKVSKIDKNDCLFVFSVGGGNKEKSVSKNLVLAIEYAHNKGSKVIGIVGRDGGYTKLFGDAVVVIPTVSSERITPLTEGFQAIIWHLLVSHPILQSNPTKWESIE